MDLHPLRKQPGRVLLLALTGTSLFLLFVNQTHLGNPYRTDHSGLPPLYPSRRIQDYQNPEYTSGLAGVLITHGSSQKDDALQDQKESKNINLKNEIRNVISPNVRKEGRGGQGIGSDVKPDTNARKDPIEIQAKEKNDQNIDREEMLAADLKIVIKENIEPIPSVNVEENPAPDPNTAMEKLVDRLRLQLIPSTVKDKMEAILGNEREYLKQDMEGYVFHPELKAKGMADLVLEQGGQPVRSLVVTTWRSGSTFIGDVLLSHPATYYHYEPLLDFGIHQVRHGDNATQAVHNLRHLLTCNYYDMENYLNYGKDHSWLLNHNKRLWKNCISFPDLCYHPDFLSAFCSLFPFQSLKTVRLRLNLTTELLQDKKLGVQVLLLVRDPRGTMQSRHHREWCPDHADCNEPANLCQDLVRDYNTALTFRKKFPHSFRVIRYEDLSFHAYNTTKELFNFFRLNYHPKVQEFLDTHTKMKIGGVSSTFRDSKTAPVHWQQDLSWQEVESIQRVCSKALQLWGYEIAKDKNHLRTFMPVGKFKNI